MNCGGFGCTNSLQPRQLDALQQLVTKHVADPSLSSLVGEDDAFAATSTERGLLRWEQGHLVAALDVLNAYQRDRRARMAGMHMGRKKQYRDDPRTRLVELLKRWLRSHAGNNSVGEEEVRGIANLCRDVLNHAGIFPARNPRSFLQSIAEVYDHMQYQLKEVLERERSCSDIVQRALSLGRNLISDAVGFLLVGPTELWQTDQLPSLEVVTLWQTMERSEQPRPGRADPTLQAAMRDTWATQCGSLIAALVTTASCLRLFDGGSRADADASRLALSASTASADGRAACSVAALLADVAAQFSQGQFRNSGLAGVMRDSAPSSLWRSYLDAVQLLHDLSYLLGEVLVQFHCIGDGLGDYGMIRISSWLHPCLDTLSEKAQRLKRSLEHLNEAVETSYVLARARKERVKIPAPTDRMCSRAHSCVERAVSSRGSHTQALLLAIEELRAKSAPERLPTVMGTLGDACGNLQAVLQSPEFRASVGDDFPELPGLHRAVTETQQAPTGGRRASIPTLKLGAAAADDGSEEESGEEGTDELPGAEQRALLPTLPPQSSSGWPPQEPVSCFGDRTPPALCRTGSCGLSEMSGQMSESTAVPSHTTSYMRGTVSDGDSADVMTVDVWRLTPSRIDGRLKRREQRQLLLCGCRLEIGAARGLGSELSLHLRIDVDGCTLEPGAVLTISSRRVPEGAGAEDGVFEHRRDIFEFESVELAAMLHDRIAAVAQCG